MIQVEDGRYSGQHIKMYDIFTNIKEDERAKEMCPICKTDKYLSPNMTFLINPECYHKICESCVDRIFSLGPAPCPYPKCGKILRKNKFKKQVFDDLKIEKEIDIRKRISAIYNKTEEDFKDLKDYNEYLEGVEELVFNLNNDIDVEQTEVKVEKYENDNKIEIIERNLRESQKNADLNQYKEALERLRQEKLRIQKQMEVEDLEYQKQQEEDLLQKLSSSNANSEDLVQQSQTNLIKRSSLRKRQLQQISNQLEEQFLLSNPLLKNIKLAEDMTTPFTPFNGDRDLQKRYHLLPVPRDNDALFNVGNKKSDSYYDPNVNKLAKNKEYLGAGWRLHTVFERALDEAFMGLGCFIDTEKHT
ncbi:uncharacterized protein PRCAT00005987001 [Priceomyces carsonii]|uniref:uncharacterized protein n=1 Tax=Priceomyces carsonii TaxID=28549 RepID=UPI002ED8F95D|nr:unnamed protein product [Priceomyces carsonii]